MGYKSQRERDAALVIKCLQQEKKLRSRKEIMTLTGLTSDHRWGEAAKIFNKNGASFTYGKKASSMYCFSEYKEDLKEAYDKHLADVREGRRASQNIKSGVFYAKKVKDKQAAGNDDRIINAINSNDPWVRFSRLGMNKKSLGKFFKAKTRARK